MSGKVTLFQIIQARIEELLESRFAVAENDLTSLYRDVLLTYLQADSEGLDTTIQLMAAAKAPSQWLTLSRLRQQILTMKIERPLAEEVALLSQNHSFDDLFRGECGFVSAMAFDQLTIHVRSRDLYAQARTDFEKAGAHRKAVKCLQNYVSQESCIHPHKKLLSDYHLVYRKARKLREFAVAGLALNNISREYRLVGSMTAALKYVNRALIFLERERGSRCFYLALANRCHLLTEAGRIVEAKMDWEELRVADFPEVRGAVSILGKILSTQPTGSIGVQNLTFSWRERLAEIEGGSSKNKIENIYTSELESRLLTLLTEKPRDKFELIEALYGNKIDPQAAESRFKSVLRCLRKKHPGMIILEEGKYRIVDEAVLTSQKTGTNSD